MKSDSNEILLRKNIKHVFFYYKKHYHSISPNLNVKTNNN